MVQFYVKLDTISAAKLFAIEANAVEGPVYVNYNGQLVDGKSIKALSKIDLHAVLTVIVYYADSMTIKKFKQNISEYIVDNRNTLDDSSNTS